MSYRKIISLFAVSTLALAACGTNDEEKSEANETEKTEQEDSKSQISQAIESSGDAMPAQSLEIIGGVWTVDGYEIPYVPGEAGVVSAEVGAKEGDYYAYMVENDKIVAVESNEPEISFEISEPNDNTEYILGVSGEELGKEGDTVSEEDFSRLEKILFVEAEEEEEE